MSQTLVERAGEHIAQSVREASKVTSAVAEAMTDGVEVAKRAAKQGGDAAEDFVNDSTRRIQRNPLVSVAATLVTGVAVGVLAGMAIRRK
jgi:F0F1-type ATP synthase assembly protein I